MTVRSSRGRFLSGLILFLHTYSYTLAASP
uniref:Uncharacterized protein n=1 Tax=Siphoviridae sp. ctEBu1 TaxID=2825393 RepID=A0A8S5QH71_9CAUD|nr:MAG TPA: hypothetical protein [Siphoviridae sp. ctEBu1]